MSSHTMVFGANTRRSTSWRLYRIRTANSLYDLEVQGESAGGRRCVVLTCFEPKDRAGVSFEDSAPLLDAVSLFTLSPLEWMGKCLSVGTARTSPLQSVDFIAAADAPVKRPSRTTTFGAQASAPLAEPKQETRTAPNPWSPFPLGAVEMAEVAASLLKCVTHQQGATAAVGRDEHLNQRLRLALAECRLMLEALHRSS